MATESQVSGVERSDVVSVEELEIFARYLQAWLPKSRSECERVNSARIYDLDCGSLPSAVAAASARADRLRARVLDESRRCHAQIHYQSVPRREVLRELLPGMRSSRTANLLFLHDADMQSSDQLLVRELNRMKRTDLLVSVSSMWLRQFAASTEAEYWGITQSDIDAGNVGLIHRFLAYYFRNFIGSRYLIAPFSLQCAGEVSSLLFASRNSAHAQRFLQAAWYRDPYCCETNYDLYQNSEARRRLALLNAKTVLEFQKELMTCLENGKFRSDREIYLYTLQRGFLGRHALDTVSAFCHRYGACFTTRTGKPARARLSPNCFRRERPIEFH